MKHTIDKKNSVKKMILFCLALLVFSITGRAQTSTAKPNAELTIIIKNSSLQKFTLRRADHAVIDSAMVGTKKGGDTLHFDLSVTGRELVLYPFLSNRAFMPIVPILVPGEHLEITADLSDPDKVSFSGSARTYEFYNFCIQRMLVGKDFAKYKIALNSGSPDSSSLKRKLDTINHLTAQFIRKTIFNTDCGLIVVLALIDSQNGVVTYTKQELNELREKFKDDSIILGQLKINEDLQGNPERLKPKPANGSYLATFKLPDINGKQVRLDQFKGKYVLLDFWASWCGPCRKQMPYIKKLSKLYHQNNFVIVSVSVDKNHGDWKKAMLQEEITALVNLIDDSGWKSSVLNQYNISSIPSNFLIDPAGKVIDKDLKGEKLLARVAEAMKMVN